MTALRAGGFGFRRFWREPWRFTEAAIHQMDPRRYTDLALRGRAVST